MSRQYFADVLSEPINASFTTITATAETVLIPTQYTGIPANEPRAGKVYELTVGGSVTTGSSGTMIITPRYGTVIGGVTLTASATQTVVPSITTAPFLYRCYLAFRSIGLGSGTSTCICTGKFECGGSSGTASSQSSVHHTTPTGAATVDTSTAQALWVGITFSVTPSVIPLWHVWRSLN